MCHNRQDFPRRHLAGPDSACSCLPAAPGRDDSQAVAATRELSEDPALKSKLLQGMRVPLEECIPEEEVVR